MSEPVWDDRLLTRERALELVEDWPFALVLHPGEGSIHLHCQREPFGGPNKACYQSMGRYVPGYRMTLKELLAGVLRHAVTAHELDVGSRRRRHGPDEGAPHLGDGAGGRGDRDPGDRPVDQADGPSGARGALGGEDGQ